MPLKESKTCGSGTDRTGSATEGSSLVVYFSLGMTYTPENIHILILTHEMNSETSTVQERE